MKVSSYAQRLIIGKLEIASRGTNLSFDTIRLSKDRFEKQGPVTHLSLQLLQVHISETYRTRRLQVREVAIILLLRRMMARVL